jgi:glycosyltransferase involved in cell wall biosynthesis
MTQSPNTTDVKPPPFFSVITPSYNMLQFLPACCNSVSDQNVKYEHIVVDAKSIDGTAEWLKNRPDLVSVSERDHGMYEAINKGVQMSRGEIISYLNCDEQYLPGVLRRVAEIFRSNSKIDVLFGNALIIRPNGELLAYRKSFIPRWPYVWASHMYTHSSSMFIRRKVFESGVLFDQSLRAIGDADFVVRMLRKGFVAHHQKEYFSAFMITGSNLGDGENALVELKTFRNKAPLWLRHFGFITDNLIRLEKIWNGAYWEKMPLSYSVYTAEFLDVRSEFVVKEASPLYPYET